MRSIIRQSQSEERREQSWTRRICSPGCLAALVVVAVAGLIPMQAQEAFPLPAIDPPGAKAAAPAKGIAPAPAARSTPQQTRATVQKTNTPEVAKQCAELLKLATDLKAAVDQSSASTLSVTVVRKAGEIEQLAHKVRNANAKN